MVKIPSKKHLNHTDYLMIEKQVKNVQSSMKRMENLKNKDQECTFKPTINQNSSLQNISQISQQYKSRLSRQTQKALKLHVIIKDDNKELFFLSSKNDIYRELQRVKQKYKLTDKKIMKLENILKQQWESFIYQNN